MMIKTLHSQHTIHSLSDYFRDNITCHFAASMISGFVTTLASMPVDIAKTRYVCSESLCKYSTSVVQRESYYAFAYVYAFAE